MLVVGCFVRSARWEVLGQFGDGYVLPDAIAMGAGGLVVIGLLHHVPHPSALDSGFRRNDVSVVMGGLIFVLVVIVVGAEAWN